MQQHIASAVVLEIGWERIWLKLEIQVSFSPEWKYQNEEIGFYLVDCHSLQGKARFHVEKKEGQRYRLKMNITNPGNCRCIESGLYTLVLVQHKCQIADAVILPEMVETLPDASRNFLFGAGERAYTVTFLAGDSDTEIPFQIRTLASSKMSIDNAAPKKKSFLINYSRWYKAISRNFMRGIYQIMHKYHTAYSKKSGVLFLSEQSNTISANLKAVRDRMVRRGLGQDYRIFESYRRTERSGIKKYIQWFDVVNKLARADYVFIDDHAPFLDWFVLNKDTTLVQLWHAGAGFKSSGYSRWGHLGSPGPYNCHRQYTYGIAGSKKIRHFFSEVWGINDSMVLPTGMPRMDEYLDKEYQHQKKRELYNQFPMCKEKKVILFAPTYRGNNQAQAGYPYHMINFSELYDVCRDKYMVLFKMHPWVKEPVPIPDAFKKQFIDVSKYPNINDLFYITDLLITDYSSNIFEYSLMGKPMLFFAFDYAAYSFTRGFHRNYREAAPGKVCDTFASLIEAIKNENFESEKVEKYVKQHFDYFDTHAADRVLDWILLDRLPQEIKQEIQKESSFYNDMGKLDFSR